MEEYSLKIVNVKSELSALKKNEKGIKELVTEVEKSMMIGNKNFHIEHMKVWQSGGGSYWFLQKNITQSFSIEVYFDVVICLKYEK